VVGKVLGVDIPPEADSFVVKDMWAAGGTRKSVVGHTN
jgi:hypothetical protein